MVPVGRSAERTAAIAAELGVAPLTADFTNLADVRRLAADLLERCARIDVLANNTGGLCGAASTPWMATRYLPGQCPGAVPAHAPAHRAVAGERRPNHHHLVARALLGRAQPGRSGQCRALAASLRDEQARRRHPDSRIRPAPPGARRGRLPPRVSSRRRSLATCRYSGSWRLTRLRHLLAGPEQGAKDAASTWPAPANAWTAAITRRVDAQWRASVANDPVVARKLWESAHAWWACPPEVHLASGTDGL